MAFTNYLDDSTRDSLPVEVGILLFNCACRLLINKTAHQDRCTRTSVGSESSSLNPQ